LEGYSESRQDEKVLLVGHTIPEDTFKRLPCVARQTDRQKVLGTRTCGPKGALAIARILPMESARPKDSGPRTIAECLPL
jgi:hypothetical protein